MQARYAGQQPPSAPPPKPHRLRRGCLYGILGAVGLIIVIIIVAAIASSGGGGGGSTAGSSGSSAAVPSAGSGTTSQPGVGDKVRDGKFEFVITKVSHAKTVGPTGLSETAQGRFTILHVKVTNIGSESQTLDDSNQVVFDSNGRKFDADTKADLVINGANNQVFLEDINPGNTDVISTK